MGLLISRFLSDGGQGGHLDHDIRALVNARGHDSGFMFLLLTKGKKRELSGCEEDRTDFKRKLHLYLLNPEIAAQNMRKQCPAFVPARSGSSTQLGKKQMFGPLGPSLAPYVRSSRTLSKWVKPLATWYANLSGYRRVGLVYDDLRTSHNPTIKLRA